MSSTRAKSFVFPTPLDAANAFYDAIEARDIEAMMVVWAEDEEIMCVHPGGPRHVGYSAVRASWGEAFAGDSRMRLHLSGQLVLQTISMAVQSVTEHQVYDEEGETRGSVEATNIFLHTPAGWRMLAHHASVTPQSESLPTLLSTRLH